VTRVVVESTLASVMTTFLTYCLMAIGVIGAGLRLSNTGSGTQENTQNYAELILKILFMGPSPRTSRTLFISGKTEVRGSELWQDTCRLELWRTNDLPLRLT